MLKIAIVGEANQSWQIKKLLEHYSIQYNTDFEVTIYTSCSKFYESVYLKCIFDIIFLDIDMEEVMQICIHFNETLLDEDIAIVITSTERSCPAEFVKLRPVDYITYPLNYIQLKECISRYMRLHGLIPVLFSYTKNRIEYKIAVSRIVYLQSRGRKIVIHTKNDCIDFYGKLSDCKLLSCFRTFIEVHQSFLVNATYIEQLKRDSIVLTTGESLPVSRNKQKNIKDPI